MNKKDNTTNKDRTTFLAAFAFMAAFLAGTGCEPAQNGRDQSSDPDEPLTAQYYYSGFDSTSNTYNSISTASDGRVYYVLSSGSMDKGGQAYVYDPETDQVEFLADLTEISGENEQNTIPQGKSHVNFFERNGRLYFATHLGVYEKINGIELIPQNLPDGYEPYPGGHFLSYDMETGEFEKLATAPGGEGIITMRMDQERGHIYGITWPSGYFLHYDVENGTLKNMGRISGRGEAGTPGDDFRVLPRSMVVDPESGTVYYSTADGDIHGYNPVSESIDIVEGVSMRLDYFGQYDPTRPGDMAYHWRKIVWYPEEEVAYGVHATSGYLFRFDPREPSLEVVERITSEPSKRTGMFDQFYYGYLGFDLGPDGETLYYLTGSPAYIDGKRVERDEEILIGARGLENLHLVTYHIPDRKYTDHGPIYYPDGSWPTYANSIAVGHDGSVYTIARHERDGNVIMDLVKIPSPFE
ncbi:MAG: hypothetical protein WD317_04120 [Balneolaceae bacterium]